MEFTEKEYQQMSKKASPGSPVGKNCALAFLVGGLLCALAEVECQLLVMIGTELTVARTLSSCSLILLSAVLTAFQVFDNIAKHAGAGTLVPITGFANSVVAPAIEF
ncbi:MAG: SpoVA/SpoVAEb family sporulation membrane protein, partial [Clostridia bacterium]|nr:SpoVA/SpoVAEb family sporulation membrane protein [Clostridia bacterium]